MIYRANNQSALFYDEGDYAAFLSRLQKYRHRWPFEIHHYALMTTHVHLVCHVGHSGHISWASHGVQLSYCHYFQRKYPSVGHLWHSRFRSIPIESEKHLMRCGRYAELNPPKAGLVAHPSQYRWTSYHAYASGRADDLITPTPLYEALGVTSSERQFTYQEYIAEGLMIDWSEEEALFENRRPWHPNHPRWTKG